MSFRQMFFIKFVLYLPDWTSGDKNLCSTLVSRTISNIMQKCIIYIDRQENLLFNSLERHSLSSIASIVIIIGNRKAVVILLEDI